MLNNEQKKSLKQNIQKRLKAAYELNNKANILGDFTHNNISKTKVDFSRSEGYSEIYAVGGVNILKVFLNLSEGKVTKHQIRKAS